MFEELYNDDWYDDYSEEYIKELFVKCLNKDEIKDKFLRKLDYI